MINVEKIQDSLNENTDSRLTTFEWEYPRFIHAEVLTHRVFSKNAGSSRAVPVMSAIELASNSMVVPNFKYNKAGMQPAKHLSEKDMELAIEVWRGCANSCIDAAEELASLKVHKQWANRMLEWFSPIKIVLSGTDFANFLWLRNDIEAQDELAHLAEQVENLLNSSKPTVVEIGHAHVPYVDRTFGDMGVSYGRLDHTENGALTMTEACKVSASVCAQMSYRKSDDSMAKANDMYEKFIRGRRIHSSPFEHQAICAPANIDMVPKYLDSAITHFDRQGRWYSGNLRGWIQYRHLIPNNTCHSLEGVIRL